MPDYGSGTTRPPGVRKPDKTTCIATGRGRVELGRDRGGWHPEAPAGRRTGRSRIRPGTPLESEPTSLAQFRLYRSTRLTCQSDCRIAGDTAHGSIRETGAWPLC